MENNEPKSGFWMLTETLTDESFNEEQNAAPPKKEDLKDGYDFFPDASF